MRKLLIGLAVLVFVLVAAVFVVPSLIDWNGYKPEIQAAAREATGRELRLDGDIGLRLLPSPSLSVENVAFANFEGGTAPDMVGLESLQVHVALLPLLTGSVHVTSVTLVRPTIVLERLADGRANWEFPGSEAPAGTGAGGGGSDGGSGVPAVALDSATIEDGTLVFRDAAAGAEHRIEALNATVSASGFNGPFEARGSLAYQGLPLAIEASLGRLDEQRPSAVRITLSAAEKALTATVAGTLDRTAGPAFSGEAAIEAPDLGKAVERLNAALGGSPVPVVGAGQKLALTAGVTGSPTAVELADLTVMLGESRLKGGVSVALADVPTIDAKLTGNRLDLDALMPGDGPVPTPASGGTSGAVPAPAAGDEIAFALPTGISGSVDIAIDAVQYRGAAIRKLRFAGDLVDGAANLRLATAQLPGGTETTVTGTVLSNGSGPQFVGRLEAVSDNLRGTLDWAGIDTSGVAPDRLRKASVRAAIDATPRKVEVTDWTMELDATNAKGGLTLVVRERPAFGLSLEVDRINVDAYLPAPAGTPASGEQPAQGSPAQGNPAPSGNPLAALNAVDANVNIKVGEATAFGVPIRDARIDALLQNGTLTLRDVGVADLGGARATIAGVLRDAAGKPSVDMNFDVTVVNVDRFAKLLSTESPIPAKQLGQVALKGTAAGDMQDVKVDMKLTAAGGSFGVKGTAKPLASPPGLDLTLSLSHPDAGKLAAVLAPEALDGVGPLGPLNGEGSIRTRDDGRYANKLNISVAGGALALVGNAAPFAEAPDVDMAIELVHSDAVKLFRTFAPKYRPAGRDLGGLKARTRFKGPVDNLRLFETEFGLGAIRATGEGAIDSRGARPKVTLALAANAVAIDPWLPPSAPKPAGAVPAAPAAPAREWSRERIDTSALSALDADLKATIESIVYGSYVVDNAQLAATLSDGVLDLSKLAGGMFGGSFDMTGRVADRQTPTAAIVIKVRDADVRQAAQSAANTDMVSGILTYDTDLKTQGASEFDLVSALAGNGSFRVRDGVVKGFDLQAFSNQLKALDRAPDFVHLAQKSLSGGETRFSSLAGSYTVTKGVLRSNDIALQADAAAGSATAVVDLPPQQMDVRTSFQLTEHPNGPPVGVRLVGPLDNPRRIFEIEEMQAYVIQRLVERGVLRQFDKDGKAQELLKGLQGGGRAPAPAPTPAVESGAPPPDPAQQQPAKPEEAVRDLLKGLLKRN